MVEQQGNLSMLREIGRDLTRMLESLDAAGEAMLALRVDHARAEVAERIRAMPCRPATASLSL